MGSFLSIFLSITIALIAYFTSTSWDYQNYQRDFILSSTSDDFINLRYEALFNYLFFYFSKVFSFEEFRCLEIFFTNLIYLKGALKVKNYFYKNLKISDIEEIFFVIAIFFSNLTTLYGSRQGLAISIACYAFPILMEKNLVKKILATFIISQIHLPVAINFATLNIIFYLYIVIRNNFKKLNKLAIFLILALSISIPLTVVLISQFDILFLYVPALKEIITPGMYAGGGDMNSIRLTVKFLEITGLILIVILLGKKKSEVVWKYLFSLICILIGFYIAQFNDIGNTIFGRSTTIIRAINIPLIYFLVISNTKANYKLISLSIITLFSIYRLYEYIIIFL